MNEESNPSSRLGRGLGAMFNEVSTIKAGSAPTGGGFLRIPVNDLALPGTARLPDQNLIESIRKYGVLQPILVARAESGFRLLAGARRLQAAREAGLADVPALIVPPDRAGAMDVYLEENLTRAELTEVDRMRLRDQWARETGRDPELAKRRIPDLPQPAATVIETPPEASSRGWMVATLLLAPACLVLLAMLVIAKPKPLLPEKTGITTEIDAAKSVDHSWMESFRFPGQSRATSGSRLLVAFTDAMFSEGEITPSGARYLSQLAAVGAASPRPVTIRLLLNSGDAEFNQRHAELAVRFMQAEGFTQVNSIAEQRDPNLGRLSTVIAEIVPVQ